jgi:hypothetical protein
MGQNYVIINTISYVFSCYFHLVFLYVSNYKKERIDLKEAVDVEFKKIFL